MQMTATYSPDDNKLRLYSSTRLDRETYDRVRAAGFSWAPKQELFVAPSWTPQREDLLLELCGEIGDEDKSLVERAGERAERFVDYSEKRADEADGARAAVARIADGIPLGQPILVGHHSERHARKDAERIENGMRKAVKLWETSKYWTSRAAGAIAHAKYKERPDVRARRIKKLEAERRGFERSKKKMQAFLRVWSNLHDPESLKKGGEVVSFQERALHVANIDMAYGLWSDLRDGKVTPEEAQKSRVAGLTLGIANTDRWMAHLDNRLAYEKAMLGDSGYVPPPKPKTSAALPLLNYDGEIAYRNPYRNEIIRVTAHHMTKAELAAISTDYKGTRVSEDGTHRVRTAMVRATKKADGSLREHGLALVAVFLTDSKKHERPGADAAAVKAKEEAAALEERLAEKTAEADARACRQAAAEPERAAEDAADAPFKAIRESLKAGVTVVSAPQLFPTPKALARDIVRRAGVQNGHRVLEPSAGTGALLEALYLETASKVIKDLVAVEVDGRLSSDLQAKWNADVRTGDFLQLTTEAAGGLFDRIIMNPPFGGGQDILHMRHALKMLAPSGRLVALCAAGPRQRQMFENELEPRGGRWEDLPAGSFSEQGTGVSVALITFDAPAAAEAKAS
jgi:predicted RNA methylase